MQRCCSLLFGRTGWMGGWLPNCLRTSWPGVAHHFCDRSLLELVIRALGLLSGMCGRVQQATIRTPGIGVILYSRPAQRCVPVRLLHARCAIVWLFHTWQPGADVRRMGRVSHAMRLFFGARGSFRDLHLPTVAQQKGTEESRV